MKYMISQSTDMAYNLALEEYVFTKLADEDFLILWVNRPGIVVGKFQNVFQEIDMKRASLLNIPVYRRITGGGCVYHDEGNLNFSVMTRWAMAKDSYSPFLDPVLKIINACGVKAYRSGICNLSVNGKKFSGNAQSIYRGRILHHGTLLFDTRLDVMSGIIKTDYVHFQSKAMRSAPAPVGNLKDCSGFRVSDLGTLRQLILTGMGCTPEDSCHFSKAEENEILSLADKKYRTWEWNIARSATFTYDSPADVYGNYIHIEADQGVIRDVQIYFKTAPGEMLVKAAEALRGRALDYPRLHELLRSYGTAGRHIEDLIFMRDGAAHRVA